MSISATAASLCTTDQPRTWKITTTNGITAHGYLPYWAEDDPSETGLDPESLHVTLVDVGHRSAFRGVTLTAFTPEGGARRAQEIESFHGEIACHPYSDSEAPDESVVPVVNVQVGPDCWVIGLEPVALAELAAKLRTHADYLEGDVLPRLVAAREDWAAHHCEDTQRS